MAPPPVQGLKQLRVALIQGAKITEDRTLKRRGPVSVGLDAKNTFVVPVSNLPPSFTLFEYVNNQYTLVFTEKMEGKVKTGADDADLTFAALRQQGRAKQRGGGTWALPLTDTMKGRVQVGEVSLLFQFVTPPPEPPRPELPANIRGSFFAGLDQFFFLILGVSLFIHFSGATFVACQPMPEERELSMDELPDRFAKAMMPEAKPPPKPEKVAEGPKDEKPKDEKPKEAKAEAKPADAAAKKAAMEKAVASKGLLKILGASGGGGALQDVLGGSTGAGDIANALAGAGGVQVGTAEALAAGQKGGGSGRQVGIGDLGTAGAGTVDIGSKGDAVIRGKVADATPELDSADVDREALAKYVRLRKQAIQACYERELKRNPSLKGKVVVRFSIGPSGRVKTVEIEENTLGNDAVGACISAVIRSWTFPFKPSEDVPVAYPFVFSPAS